MYLNKWTFNNETDWLNLERISLMVTVLFVKWIQISHFFKQHNEGNRSCIHHFPRDKNNEFQYSIESIFSRPFSECYNNIENFVWMEIETFCDSFQSWRNVLMAPFYMVFMLGIRQFLDSKVPNLETAVSIMIHVLLENSWRFLRLTPLRLSVEKSIQGLF